VRDANARPSRPATKPQDDGPDYARAVAFAREARPAATRSRPVSLAVLGLAVLGLAIAGIFAVSGGLVHARGSDASLGSAADVLTASIREVDDMRSIGAAACLFVAIPCVAGQNNLVSGGDFEAVPQGGQGGACHSTLLPVIPGWNSNAGYQVDRSQIDGTCGLPFLPTNPFGGRYCISLQGSVCCGCNNNGWIQQVVPSTAGQTYLLRADVCLDYLDSLRITIGGDSIVLSGNKDFTWAPIEIEFVAAGNTTIRFASESPSTVTPTPWDSCWEGEGAMIDNIQVIEKPACLPDVIPNGLVDGADLSALLSVWGTNGGLYPRADCNADGLVDGQDLAIVLGGWGACP
jgi:hypothetical protein